jgi:hypothetical protein
MHADWWTLFGIKKPSSKKGESKGSKFETSRYNLGRYLIKLNPLNMLID